MFTNNSAPPDEPIPPGLAAWSASIAGVAFGLAMITFGLSAIDSYGVWLFIATPFVMGAVTAFVYNHRTHASWPATVRLVVAMVGAAGVAALLFKIEGAICIIMATPLAFALAMAGAAAGRRFGGGGSGNSPLALLLLFVPLTAAVEPESGRTLHEVQSSVVINATPAEVWPHVVAFRDMPEPEDWLFRSGIAYPIRARIEGTGVGAVRYCEFSTGAFVEPITRWEPARRLSFDVAASPVPMRELSPYPDLSPRHLHGFLRSKRGEFRFIDLGDGRTRLEGSTWYEIEMAPEAYWRMWSDYLIHRIHHRVLDHIKNEVEGGLQ